MNWHLLPLSEIERLLNTTPSGIDSVTASQLLAEHGKNQLEKKKRKTILQMLLQQLLDFMILILVAAAIISGILGDIIDTIIILAIIVINTAVGVIQEYRAQKAMEALKKMASGIAQVVREGTKLALPFSELVPGDLLFLEVGNIIPADIRFFETHQIKVDESVLTGESHNVQKHPEELPQGDYVLGDRINMGYKGTHVTSGSGLAYVVATGMSTELGRIARMIQTEEAATPLQKRLTVFGKQLSVGILIVCALIFGIGIWRGETVLSMLLTSISLAVAAIPEALAALVTIALAFGAKRLVKSNVLIRKLAAVESLGSVGYICTDKTGTLTLNKMTVEEIFETSDETANLVFGGQNALLAAIALNNDTSIDSSGKWLGDSTELALARYAFDKNYKRTDLELKYPRVAELPFDSTRKCMSTLHKCDKGVLLITKGAVEELLGKLNEEQKTAKAEFEFKANEMAAKGYRVLGYAVKRLADVPDNLVSGEIESALTLIGFTAMIDPPREEAKQAVAQCKEAGIIAVMITGDHKLTAMAIAKRLGILESEEDLVLSGPELTQLKLEEFEDIVERVRVYARVNPEQKLKIITALQDKNHFVAMTGDGVNDAPALKNANIGIAMGINGTEVSKEASQMILLDDNFSTIVVAIKQGRRIFDNILKFIKYIMTGNSGELWAIFLAPFLGLPMPLLPIQILWINLVSDSLPGLALGSESADAHIMKRPPRSPGQNIFSRAMMIHILWVGFLIGLITLGIQAWAIENEKDHWQTMAFSVLCFAQLAHAMAIRSERESIFRIGLFSNKYMIIALSIAIALQLMVIYSPFFNVIFKTQALTVNELALTIGVSCTVFFAVEIEKWIKRKWG